MSSREGLDEGWGEMRLQHRAFTGSDGETLTGVSQGKFQSLQQHGGDILGLSDSRSGKTYFGSHFESQEILEKDNKGWDSAPIRGDGGQQMATQLFIAVTQKFWFPIVLTSMDFFPRTTFKTKNKNYE